MGLRNLILTRREGERIVVGDRSNPDLVITITKVRGNRAKVSIEADESLPLTRGELIDRERDNGDN